MMKMVLTKMNLWTEYGYNESKKVSIFHDNFNAFKLSVIIQN